MKATHSEKAELVGYQCVPLLPGQFVFGRKQAAFETGLSERSFRTSLLTLEKLGNLTIKPTNKFSILTVEKWENYQTGDQQASTKTANKRPSNDQQTTTNKNVKNNKNAKKKIPPKSPQGGRGYAKAFEIFWAEYPKKVGKQYAFKCWKRIKGVDAPTIIGALKAQLGADHFRGNDGQQYFLNPSTWLNQGRWEDEIERNNDGDDALPPELRR